jgi:hypothetical protein
MPDKYDAALILANVSDFAQQGALRIKWSMPMGPEMPWYAAEVPTVFVSLNMPNHLIDVPMVKTAINAHTPTRRRKKRCRRSLRNSLDAASSPARIMTTSGAIPGIPDADPPVGSILGWGSLWSSGTRCLGRFRKWRS